MPDTERQRKSLQEVLRDQWWSSGTAPNVSSAAHIFRHNLRRLLAFASGGTSLTPGVLPSEQNPFSPLRGEPDHVAYVTVVNPTHQITRR